MVAQDFPPPQNTIITHQTWGHEVGSRETLGDRVDGTSIAVRPIPVPANQQRSYLFDPDFGYIDSMVFSSTLWILR